MSKEGDRAAVFRTTKVRTKLKGDASWLRRGNDPEGETQEEKPWLAEVRASRVNGAPPEASPVSSPTNSSPPPTVSGTERAPTSGYLIRGVFTKLDQPASPSSNGFSSTTQFTKKPSESYKRLAPHTVRPTSESQEGELSPEEMEKRTEAASSVLKKSAVRQRSYVLSAAKKYESTEKAPEAPPVNSTPSFVAKRVEITDDDDDESAVTPASAKTETPPSPVVSVTPAVTAPEPKPRKTVSTAAKTVAVNEPVAPKVEEVNREAVKEDPLPVSVTDKDPSKEITPGCPKVATPLPELIVDCIRAVSTKPDPEDSDISKQAKAPLVELSQPSSQTPKSSESPAPLPPASTTAVQKSPAAVSPAPVVPAPTTAVQKSPAPVSPVPVVPDPVLPAPTTAVQKSPAAVSPVPEVPVPVVPVPVVPAPTSAVQKSPAPVTPVPVVPAPTTAVQKSPASGSPAPVVPAPVVPVPVVPAPTPAVQKSPAPVSPAPVVPAPTSAVQKSPAAVSPAPVVPASTTAVQKSPAPVSPAPVVPAPTSAVQKSPAPVSPVPVPVVPAPTSAVQKSPAAGSPAPVVPAPTTAVQKSPAPVSPAPVVPVPVVPAPTSAVQKSPAPVSPVPVVPVPVVPAPPSSDPVLSGTTVTVKMEPKPESTTEPLPEPKPEEKPKSKPAPEPSASVDTLTALSNTLISIDTSPSSIKDDEPALAQEEEEVEEEEGSAGNETAENSNEEEAAPALSNCEPITDDLLGFTNGSEEEPAEPVPSSPGRWSQDLLSEIDSLSMQREEEEEEEEQTDETAKDTQSQEDNVNPWRSHVKTTVTESSSADPFDPYPIGTTSPNSSSDLIQPLADISINSLSPISTKDKNPEMKSSSNALKSLADDIIPINTSRSTQRSWETGTPQQTDTEESQEAESGAGGQALDQQTLVLFERKSAENDSPWDRWTSPTVYTITTATGEEEEEEEEEEEQEESPEDTQTVTTITTIREIHGEPEPAMDRSQTYSSTVKEEEQRVQTPEPEAKKGFVFVKEYVNASELSLQNLRDMVDSSMSHSYSIPSRDPLSTTCTYCGQQVGCDGKITIEHLNINCHPACFKCDMCSKPMGDLLYSMFLHGGKVYCEGCYSTVI